MAGPRGVFYLFMFGCCFWWFVLRCGDVVVGCCCGVWMEFVVVCMCGDLCLAVVLLQVIENILI